MRTKSFTTKIDTTELELPRGPGSRVEDEGRSEVPLLRLPDSDLFGVGLRTTPPISTPQTG